MGRFIQRPFLRSGKRPVGVTGVLRQKIKEAESNNAPADCIASNCLVASLCEGADKIVRGPMVWICDDRQCATESGTIKELSNESSASGEDVDDADDNGCEEFIIDNFCHVEGYKNGRKRRRQRPLSQKIERGA